MAVTYLRNVTTGTFRKVEDDSAEYRRLQKIKTSDGRFPLYEETSPQAAAEPDVEFLDVVVEPVPAVTIAATADNAIGEAPFGGRVTEVTYTPEADITGVNTNTRKISLVNKGQDGNGNVEVAALQFDAAVNASDFDEKALVLNATPANLNVVEGDILVWLSAAVGTGLADPGGLAQVKVARGAAA